MLLQIQYMGSEQTCPVNALKMIIACDTWWNTREEQMNFARDERNRMSASVIKIQDSRLPIVIFNIFIYHLWRCWLGFVVWCGAWNRISVNATCEWSCLKIAFTVTQRLCYLPDNRNRITESRPKTDMAHSIAFTPKIVRVHLERKSVWWKKKRIMTYRWRVRMCQTW